MREHALRDSLYKEDSILSIYVMEKLKPRIVDSLQGDSMRVRDTIKDKWNFPLLSPASRKVVAKAVTVDSCGEAIVAVKKDSVASPITPATKPTLATKPSLTKPSVSTPKTLVKPVSPVVTPTNNEHKNYEVKADALPAKPAAEPAKPQDKGAIKVME